jgi:hypothetical protein
MQRGLEKPSGLSGPTALGAEAAVRVNELEPSSWGKTLATTVVNQ